MLHLHVRIDPNSGFCFGVIYAIQMAEDILDEQGYLYCLGDIVHNDEEVQRLQKRGLRIIDHEKFKLLQNEHVLIRAHGEPPDTYRIALENNLNLIDASCPVVLKLQNRIKTSYDKKEQIFIYGKHGHAEVVGLLGQTSNNAVVFENIDEQICEMTIRRKMPIKAPTDNCYAKKKAKHLYRKKYILPARGYIAGFLFADNRPGMQTLIGYVFEKIKTKIYP